MLLNGEALDVSSLLRERRLLMVGGKGGVGKTTISSALALRAAASSQAHRGRRVLLVSTDPAHSLSDAFDTKIGDRETALAENLTGLEIDPDAEVENYLDRVRGQMARFAAPEQRGALERQLKLSRQSPGAQEAALLERITAIIDETERYDLIIFDTAPTGHTLRLLSLPEIMSVWTEGLLKQSRRGDELGKVLSHLQPGRELNNPTTDMDERSRALVEPLLERQSRFRRARRVLQDASESAFVFVLTAERLPILETERAVASLQEAGIPVAGAIVNRVLPESAGEGEFLQSRWQREQRLLRKIEECLGELPKMKLPLLADDIQGLQELRKFAEQIV